MSDKELKTLQSGQVVQIRKQDSWEWNGKTNGSYLVDISVPGTDHIMPLEVTTWGEPNAECPLKMGPLPGPINYEKSIDRNGETRYRYKPAKAAGDGWKAGGGPRMELEISQVVNDQRLTAKWIGYADKVDEGIKTVHEKMARLVNPSILPKAAAAPIPEEEAPYEEVPF